MRISALAVATLLLAFGASRTTLGQAPATAKAQGIFCQQCQQTKPTTSVAQRRSDAAQAANYAAQQASAEEQAYSQQPQSAGDVQQAGHRPATPYPVFNPNCPHSAGTGTFPNGSPYDHGHPGRPFDGGRYGYFGGAHRTPGYPHHHLHREYVGPQGPPSAQVGYPYYTTRGPRDFLMDNPPSIGR